MGINKRTFVFFVILLSSASIAGARANEWSVFLGDPSGTHRDELLVRLATCAKGGCPRECRPNDDELNTLLKLVEDGNTYAMDIAFAMLGFLDGGNFEDVARELGKTIEKNPSLFLVYSKKHKITDDTLESTLTMLPLNTVDNTDKRISIIKTRLNIISGIADMNIVEEKNRATRILFNDLKRLESMKEKN